MLPGEMKKDMTLIIPQTNETVSYLGHTVTLKRIFTGEVAIVSSTDPIPRRQGELAVSLVHQQLLHNQIGIDEFPQNHLSPCRWYAGSTLRGV